jgi:hypothetical protein
VSDCAHLALSRAPMKLPGRPALSADMPRRQRSQEKEPGIPSGDPARRFSQKDRRVWLLGATKKQLQGFFSPHPTSFQKRGEKERSYSSVSPQCGSGYARPTVADDCTMPIPASPGPLRQGCTVRARPVRPRRPRPPQTCRRRGR